mgnify:CR=1 FL=1
MYAKPNEYDLRITHSRIWVDQSKIGWYEIAPQAKKSDILHLKSDFCKGIPAFPMLKNPKKIRKRQFFEKTLKR